MLAAINSEAHDALANLNSMGIKTINVNRCPDLPAPVQAHTDLQLLHLGGKSILTPREHMFIESMWADILNRAKTFLRLFWATAGIRAFRWKNPMAQKNCAFALKRETKCFTAIQT